VHVLEKLDSELCWWRVGLPSNSDVELRKVNDD